MVVLGCDSYTYFMMPVSLNFDNPWLDFATGLPARWCAIEASGQSRGDVACRREQGRGSTGGSSKGGLQCAHAPASARNSMRKEMRLGSTGEETTGGGCAGVWSVSVRGVLGQKGNNEVEWIWAGWDNNHSPCLAYWPFIV
jgi:hypothetical protein